MSKIRILIVDGAALVRRLLGSALAADPALEVVGTAPNGSIALAKIPQVNPDLVVLNADLAGTGSQGLTTDIRKPYPGLPLVLFRTIRDSWAEGSAPCRTDFQSVPPTDTPPVLPWECERLAVKIETLGRQLIPEIKQCYSR